MVVSALIADRLRLTERAIGKDLPAVFVMQAEATMSVVALPDIIKKSGYIARNRNETGRREFDFSGGSIHFDFDIVPESVCAVPEGPRAEG